MFSKTRKLYTLIALIITSAFAPIQAQYSAETYFNFLESRFNEDEKDLRDYLISELNHFLTMYPENEYAGRAQYMLATTYKKHGKKHKALASYLKMILVYPQTRAVIANTEDLQKLVTKEKDYKDHRDWLTALTNKSHSNMSSEEAWVKYLSTLDRISNNDLAEWIQMENRNFSLRFSESTHHPKSLYWLGNA